MPYTHTTRADGLTLTAAIYNADHQNHIDHFTPAYLDDYSANATEMRTQTDPGESGSESLATSAAGELERLRYAIWDAKKRLDNTLTYWYQTPSLLGQHLANVRHYGAVGDGVTDDSSAIQSAINAAITVGHMVYFPAGTYKCASNLSLTCTDGQRVVWFGPGVLDMTAQGNAGTTSVTIQGSVGSSAALGADVTGNARSITCALSVSAGDVIRILSTASFTPASAAFVKGELAEVESASAGTITLKSHLHDTYTAATTTVYKLNMPRVFVDGLTILRNDNTGAGLTILYARDVRVANVRASGARDRGIYLDHCYNGQVSNCRVTDAYASGGGTNYSFVLASSQNFAVEGNQFLSGRHGVSNGGTFPFRNITYTGNIVDNTRGIPNYAFDLHANGQGITITGNVIKNGIGIECIDVTFTGNYVDCYDYTYALLINQYRNGNFLKIEGNTIYSRTSGGNGIVHTTTGSITSDYTSVVIANNTIESDSVALYFTSSSGATINFDSLVIAGNVVRNASSYPFLVSLGGGGAVSTAKCAITGNAFYARRGPQIVATWGGSFTGNHVYASTNEANALNFQGAGNWMVSGNFFDGNSASNGLYFEQSGTTALTNNLIQNMGANPVRTGASCTQLMDANNTYLSNSGSRSINAATRLLVGAFGTARITQTSNATPAALEWAVGDISHNIGNDSTFSYKCTAAGTPGTWISIA